jgi:hypothetical protein
VGPKVEQLWGFLHLAPQSTTIVHETHQIRQLISHKTVLKQSAVVPAENFTSSISSTSFASLFTGFGARKAANTPSSTAAMSQGRATETSPSTLSPPVTVFFCDGALRAVALVSETSRTLGQLKWGHAQVVVLEMEDYFAITLSLVP